MKPYDLENLLTDGLVGGVYAGQDPDAPSPYKTKEEVLVNYELYRALMLNYREAVIQGYLTPEIVKVAGQNDKTEYKLTKKAVDQSTIITKVFLRKYGGQ